jgi:xanthine dehydrogenase accessory factor
VREILFELDRWRERGDRIAMARVVATRRSAPRPVGSKLIVSETGELAGSVSGGCIESEVVEAAREVLAGGEPRLVTFGISDDLALSVGLPCGGEIDVWIDEPDAQLLSQLADVARNEQRAVFFVDLDDGTERLVLDGDNDVADELIRSGHSKIVELHGRSVFADVLGPPPRLFVYGAVDTADALCAAARAIGWRAIVADARARFATSERLPNADEVIVAWPEEALAQVAPDHTTAILVLTHDDKFDLPLLVGALASDAYYIGALGSRRNQERRRERLLEAGHRRPHSGRDGRLDAGRDHGRAGGARRWPAQGLERPHPRRDRLVQLHRQIGERLPPAVSDQPRVLHVETVVAVFRDHVRVHREDHVRAELGLDPLADLRMLDHRHPDRVARDVAEVVAAVGETFRNSPVRIVRGGARTKR